MKSPKKGQSPAIETVAIIVNGDQRNPVHINALLFEAAKVKAEALGMSFDQLVSNMLDREFKRQTAAEPLVLNLSVEQRERLELIAKLTRATVEELTIATLFAELDGWDQWEDLEAVTHGSLERYAGGVASTQPEEERAEMNAPDRLLKLCGYKFEGDAV